MLADRNDRELLLKYAAERDEEAFAEVVRRYAATVHSTAERVVGEPHAAEDAAQAVFMVLARRPDAAVGAASLGGWLRWTATNVALRLRRRTARAVRREKEAALVRQETPARPESGIDGLRPEVDAALAARPARYRDAVVLTCVEGLPREAVAAALGCPPGTASSRIARGLELLREKLRRKDVSCVALAGLLGERALAGGASAAGSLASSIVRAALGKAAASETVVRIAEDTMRSMKTAALAKTAGVAVAAAVLIGSLASYLALAGGEGGAKRPDGAAARGTLAVQVAPAQPAVQTQPTPFAEKPKSPEDKGVEVVLGPAQQEIEAGAFPYFKVTFKRDGDPCYLYLGMHQLEMSLVLTGVDGGQYRYWAGPRTDPGERNHLDLASVEEASMYVEYTCRKFGAGPALNSGLPAPSSKVGRADADLPPGQYKAKLVLHAGRPLTVEEAAAEAARAVVGPAAPAPRDMLLPDGRKAEDYFAGTMISNEVVVTVGK